MGDLPAEKREKNRRASPFKRYEKLSLVREYLACMDEISQIYSIYEHKPEILERLRKACELPENEPKAAMSRLLQRFDNTCKTKSKQIDLALNQLRSNHEGLPRTLNSLRTSLDDVSS